jgi:hypothetical protein
LPNGATTGERQVRIGQAASGATPIRPAGKPLQTGSCASGCYLQEIHYSRDQPGMRMASIAGAAWAAIPPASVRPRASGRRPLRCLNAATYFQGISMGWMAPQTAPHLRSCLRR